ncbi:hypothetical protein BRADI_4g09755v3 [Brachypodium distachyon]|uniref:Secreted protein n=1 Tax=Brachypodium distachyon TaxID=15368 RepID=A0A2K2CLM7_BRADI|nr:hypothetical protein BRADI_4g09755v3 [Brachypodium distachyon]
MASPPCCFLSFLLLSTSALMPARCGRTAAPEVPWREMRVGVWRRRVSAVRRFSKSHFDSGIRGLAKRRWLTGEAASLTSLRWSGAGRRRGCGGGWPELSCVPRQEKLQQGPAAEYSGGGWQEKLRHWPAGVQQRPSPNRRGE